VIKVFVVPANASEESRDKANKVLQKLCQINVLSNNSVIEWALQSLQTKGKLESIGAASLEFDLIKEALSRESNLKW